MTLDPVAAGGPYNVTAKVQNDSATLTDVLFGDIWMCGGQSNMWFNMTQVRLSVSVLTFRFCLVSAGTCQNPLHLCPITKEPSNI